MSRAGAGARSVGRRPSRSAAASRHGRERGGVTVEVAVVLPGVVLLLLALLWGTTAGVAQVRCQDAARVAARAFAIGEGPGDARAAALEVAGAGAVVTVENEGDWVRVTVSRRVEAPFGGSVTVQGSASVLVEPGEGP